MTAASHAFEDHTAEVLLRVHAPTLAELYAEAARGVAALLAEDPARVARGEPERVAVQAADSEALLVAWIDELVFRAETLGRVYPVVTVDRIDSGSLDATLRGGAPDTWRTAVKAATWHRLHVGTAEDGDGLVATVVLDV
jgi:SHS2 domain-containing protein